MYLRNFIPSKISNHTLWKFIKKLKQSQQTSSHITKQDVYWIRTDQEKTNIFAEHLVKIFTPNTK